LCEEFDFSELAVKLSEFRSLMDFKDAEGETEGEAKAEVDNANAYGRIASLEEKANQHSQVNAMLQDKVAQLSTDFRRLVGEISAL
jgi:hypothetical protein